MATDLYEVIAISTLNFLLPLKIFGEYILTSKANRPKGGYTTELFNDIVSFVLSAIILYQIALMYT